MKLNHLFFIALLFAVSLSKAQDKPTELERLKFQVATRDLIQKANDVSDPELKGLLTLNAIYFAEKYDFIDELWGPIMQLSYNSSFKLNREKFLETSQETIKTTMERADSTFNQFQGHFLVSKRNQIERKVAVRSIHTSTDPNSMYTAGGDGSLLKWDIENRIPTTLYSDKNMNKVVDISDNEDLIALANSDNEINIFYQNSSDGELQKIESHAGPIIDLNFLKGSSDYFTIGADGNLFYHTSDGARLIASIPIAPTTMQTTPDNKYVYIGSRKGAIVEVEIESKEINTLSFDDSWAIETLEFSHSGRYLAIGGANKNTATGIVRLYDIQQNKYLPISYDGFLSPVVTLKFSSDDDLLAAGALDDIARVWRNPSDINLSYPWVISNHKDWVFDIDFDATDQTLYTASKDGNIRSFHLDLNEYKKLLLGRYSRELTEDEWNQYIGHPSGFPIVNIKDALSSINQDL